MSSEEKPLLGSHSDSESEEERTQASHVPNQAPVVPPGLPGEDRAQAQPTSQVEGSVLGQVMEIVLHLSSDTTGFCVKELESVALSCRAIISQEEIEETKDKDRKINFSKLYLKIQAKVVEDTPSLLRLWLDRIHYKSKDDEIKRKIEALPRPDTESLYRKYPDLDMLLTLANMVTSMSDSDFETFKRYHTDRKGGSLSDCKPEAITNHRLVELMHEKDILRPDNLDNIIESLDACYLSYPKELVRYQKKRRQSVPIQWRLYSKRICIASSIFCVLSLVAVILLSVFVTKPNFIKETDSVQSNGNYITAPKATAMVGECLDPNIVSNVILKALDEYTVGTKVYKIMKKDVLSRKKILEKKGENHTFTGPKPLVVTYLTGLTPLYNADGLGMVNFSITLTNYNTSRTTCAIRLVAFNSPSHYLDYAKCGDCTDADPLHIPLNAFNSTYCTGENGTHNFPIPLVSNSYYYFVISHIIDIDIVVNISGNVYEYLKPTQESYCNLTLSDTCTINISESEECSYNNDNSHDDDKWCLLTTSSSKNRGNTSLEVVSLCRKKHRYIFFAYPGAAFPSFLLSFVACFPLSIVYLVFRVKKNSARKRFAGNPRPL